MPGTVYKRSRSNWAYQVYLGKLPNGKQHRITASGFETKKAAGNALQAKLQELQDQQAVAAGSPQTLGQLLSVYLEEHSARRCAPTTTQRYRELAAYVSPELLATGVPSLTTLQIERELQRLKDGGGHHRKTKAPRPLSARTVRHIWGLLSAALNNGIRLGILKANPAATCLLPSQDRREAIALDATQTEFYLSAARGHYLHPIMVLSAATGCRRGELLALTWPDVDFERSLLWVSKSLEQTKEGLRVKRTKTEKPRLIRLPQLAVEALRTHRAEQAARRAEFGEGYDTEADLVFADAAGGFLKPNSVTAAACLIASKAGIERVGLHSLRHSHGSQLISAGVPLPAVSKRLGHSSPRVTAEVYSHSLPHDEEAAAGVWDALMASVLKPQGKPQ